MRSVALLAVLLASQYSAGATLATPTESTYWLPEDSIYGADPESTEGRAAIREWLKKSKSCGTVAYLLGKRGAAWAVPDLADALVRHAKCGDRERICGAAAMADIGSESIPSLVEILRSSACARGSAAWALGEIGPAAAKSVPDLVIFARDQDAFVREMSVEALDRITPSWATSYVEPLTKVDPEASQFDAKPLAEEIVPYFTSQLNIPSRREEAAAYLATIRNLGRSDSPNKSREEYSIATDIELRVAAPPDKVRVGESIELKFAMNCPTDKKYGTLYGYAHRVLSGVRLDPDGKSHPVNIPVFSLARGSHSGGGTTQGPRELKSSEDHNETEFLNFNFIIDRPGRYRFTVDAVYVVLDTVKPDLQHRRVRSPSTVVEFDVLPRDTSSADRRLWLLTRDAMAVKSWDDGPWNDSELAHLIDYRAIPSLLHTLVVGANSSRSTTARAGLAYLCDKRRVHREILRNIEKRGRPRSEEEANLLAEVLATAETIPCRPEKSGTDEDYIRWMYARTRWEDKLRVKRPRP